MLVIIPMSGIGERFKKCGYSQVKPLIEVDDHPMIYHVIDLFPGESNFLFVCNENHLLSTNLRDVLLKKCPLSTIVSIEEHKLGPVYAILKAFPLITNFEEEVIVSYCDYSSDWDYHSFLEKLHSKNYDGGIAAYKNFHPHMLGKDNYAFIREENNELLAIQEKKPFTSDRMSEYASNGTYYFKSVNLLKKYCEMSIFEENSTSGEYYVSMLFNLLFRDGLKTLIFPISKMLQWGTPYDLEIYKDWSKIFSEFPQFILKQKGSNIKNITLILPMAGEGSRFQMMGYSQPKPLLQVSGKEMIIRSVECLPKCNRNIFIVRDNHFSEIEKNLKTSFVNSKVIKITSTTSGQATTSMIGIIEGDVCGNDSILISACDNGIIYNNDLFEEMLSNEGIDVIVFSFRGKQTTVNSPDMYAYLNVDDEGNVLSVSCKKFVKFNAESTPLNTHAIIGTMFFRKSEYFIRGYNKNVEENIKSNGEFYVDDVINQCIKSGLKVKVLECNYICWGTPNDYKTYVYWEDYFSRKEGHLFKSFIDSGNWQITQ